jgi:hypothetical protein
VIDHTPNLSLVIRCVVLLHPSEGPEKIMSKNVLQNRGKNAGKKEADRCCRLTKVTRKSCLDRIWRPLAIHNTIVGPYVEPERLVSFRECVIATLRVLYGLLPLHESLPTRSDGRNLRLEVSIEIKDGLGIESWNSKAGGGRAGVHLA